MNEQDAFEQAFKNGYEKGRADALKLIKGEWIRHKEDCLYNRCSICSYEHCREDNYCPNCGAKMKSAE